MDRQEKAQRYRDLFLSYRASKRRIWEERVAAVQEAQRQYESGRNQLDAASPALTASGETGILAALSRLIQGPCQDLEKAAREWYGHAKKPIQAEHSLAQAAFDQTQSVDCMDIFDCAHEVQACLGEVLEEALKPVTRKYHQMLPKKQDALQLSRDVDERSRKEALLNLLVRAYQDKIEDAEDKFLRALADLKAELKKDLLKLFQCPTE